MSKIIFKFFEGEAEIVDFDTAGKNSLELVFADSVDGFVSIDGVAAIIKDSRCVVDARLFDSGKYTPTLVCGTSKQALPTIVKNPEGFFPAECSSEYIRGLSIRERELGERVRTLEEKMEKIYKSVYGELTF